MPTFRPSLCFLPLSGRPSSWSGNQVPCVLSSWSSSKSFWTRRSSIVFDHTACIGFFLFHSSGVLAVFDVGGHGLGDVLSREVPTLDSEVRGSDAAVTDSVMADEFNAGSESSGSKRTLRSSRPVVAPGCGRWEGDRRQVLCSTTGGLDRI
jgi:hypothetical protein